VSSYAHGGFLPQFPEKWNTGFRETNRFAKPLVCLAATLAAAMMMLLATADSGKMYSANGLGCANVGFDRA